MSKKNFKELRRGKRKKKIKIVLKCYCRSKVFEEKKFFGDIAEFWKKHSSQIFDFFLFTYALQLLGIVQYSNICINCCNCFHLIHTYSVETVGSLVDVALTVNKLQDFKNHTCQGQGQGVSGSDNKNQKFCQS